jgi:hypothetical protein
MNAARLPVGLVPVLLGGAALSACGPSPLTLPQPPADLTALQQAYASPTGTVDTAALQQTVTDAKAQFDSSNLSWLPTFIADELVRIRHRFDITGFPTNPTILHQNNRPRLQAVVDAQHTCQGWSQPAGPPDAGANGSIDLTVVVDDTQLQRGLFGTATSCQERVQPVSLLAVNGFFSGTVNILLQGALPEADQDAQALVQVSGDIGTEGNVTNGSVDFQIVGNTVQFRHTVSDGFVIVSVGPSAISVRGTNGTFTCDVNGLTCLGT